MTNSSLNGAKSAKNDEFYTLLNDVSREMLAYLDYTPNLFKNKTILLPCDDPEWSAFTKFFVQKFDEFGIHKLISTSYNKSGKPGRLFTMKRDLRRKQTKFEDFEITALKGDGDFRSAEVTALRDEANFVITNPPFSKFKEFVPWVVDSNAKYAVIANINAITYSQVFPMIKENRLWLGATHQNRDMVFRVPKGTKVKEEDRLKAERLGFKGDFTRLGNACWMTNIEHSKRHEPLDCMSKKHNNIFNTYVKNSRHKAYARYENYNAIEVPAVSGIPKDHQGIMGVPINFLDRYCPEQFEIIGATESEGKGFSYGIWDSSSGHRQALINGRRVYKRLFIRAHKQSANS